MYDASIQSTQRPDRGVLTEQNIGRASKRQAHERLSHERQPRERQPRERQPRERQPRERQPRERQPRQSLPGKRLPCDWAEPPTEFIDLGHSRVAHRVFGQGPHLVFVHGWPLHGATFRALLPYLIDRYTCHLIDLPGAGHSDWGPQSPISIRDHADTLRRVIDALALERYAIVGHDSGGTIARWAVDGDERLAAMVLGNTEIPHSRPWLLRLLLALATLPAGKLLLGVFLRVGWLRRSRLMLGACFRDPDFADGDFARLFLEPLLRDRRVALGQMRLLHSFDWAAVDGLVDVHRRLRVPVQLIWGADDPFFPLAKARLMMQQFGGPTELVRVAGAKLLVHEESVGEFARAMGAFLDRHLLAQS